MSKKYQKTFPGVKNAGFTLIELLVVVLIIGILAAVALPQYEKAVEKSRATEALSLLRSFGNMIQTYYLANGKYPYSFDELDLNLNWTGKEKWFQGGLDSHSNGEWAIEFVQSTFYGLYIGRLKGAYKGGGFGFIMMQDEIPLGIYCLERFNAGVIFEKKQHEYCEKIFGAKYWKQVGSVRVYQLP